MAADLRDVLQVELVARVVLRNQQQVARLRADLLDGAHRRLHAQRQEGGLRLLKPPGNRLVSTGASLKPALRRSTDE
jgi:hypothetical protein